jgi:hypothetical protein
LEENNQILSESIESIQKQPHLPKRKMKKDYEDDPEAYWQDKADRKEQDGKEKLNRWEKENPNWPYGFKPKD